MWRKHIKTWLAWCKHGKLLLKRIGVGNALNVCFDSYIWHIYITCICRRINIRHFNNARPFWNKWFILYKVSWMCNHSKDDIYTVHQSITYILLFRDMVPCMHVHSWPLSTKMWEGEVLAVKLYTLNKFIGCTYYSMICTQQ